jgi:hypothetical protein
MPFVPALNTVRLAIDFLSVTGDEGTNVQYFRDIEGVPNPTTINNLLTGVKGWLTASWANVASDDWQVDILTARVMNTADDIIITDVETIPGLLASPTLPSQDTIAISTRTGLTGRSRRGRLYHVGLSEVQVEGSRVILAAATNLVTAYNALVSAAENAGWEWCVASFVSAGAPRSTALLTPITNVILTDTVVDSMDTRKPRAA